MPRINRRETLRSIGVLGGVAVLGGSPGSASTTDAEEASIEVGFQSAFPDPSDGDDFPVPDAFVATISSLDVRQSLFDAEELGPIALPVANSDGNPGVGPGDTFWYEAKTDADGNPLPAFVVGLHSPEVGDGRPDSLSSLIGVRPVTPGEYTGLKVPVWETPPRWQQGLGATPEQFPSNGDSLRVTATIWYGPDVFPPTAPRGSQNAIAQTPEDEKNGPLMSGDGPVSSSATVEFGPGASIAIPDQTAPDDPVDGDDFPVPDAFVATLSGVDVRSVLFEADELGPIALPVANSDGNPGVGPGDTFWYEAKTDADGNPLPAFVVGLHSPEVGNGRPGSLSSLIGVRPVVPAQYDELKVPVWAGPPRWQQGLGATPDQFPSAGDEVEVSATLWYGPDVFPPTAPRGSQNAIAQTPEDEENGPLMADDALVSSTATVQFREVATVADYAGADGTVGTGDLKAAIDDLVKGEIDSDLFGAIVRAWARGG